MDPRFLEEQEISKRFRRGEVSYEEASRLIRAIWAPDRPKVQQQSVLECELEEEQEELLFYQVGVDGILINPTLANDPKIPCKTLTRNGELTLAWKRGYIGALSHDEIDRSCKLREEIPQASRAHLEKRIGALSQASKECPEGKGGLRARLDCMAEKLQKKGAAKNLGKGEPPKTKAISR